MKRVRTFRCVVCGNDTGLTIKNIKDGDCDPVCSEACSDKRIEKRIPIDWIVYVPSNNSSVS
jgi:hypothetical protein